MTSSKHINRATGVLLLRSACGGAKASFLGPVLVVRLRPGMPTGN